MSKHFGRARFSELSIILSTITFLQCYINIIDIIGKLIKFHFQFIDLCLFEVWRTCAITYDRSSGLRFTARDRRQHTFFFVSFWKSSFWLLVYNSFAFEVMISENCQDFLLSRKVLKFYIFYLICKKNRNKMASSSIIVYKIVWRHVNALQR